MHMNSTAHPGELSRNAPGVGPRDQVLNDDVWAHIKCFLPNSFEEKALEARAAVGVTVEGADVERQLLGPDWQYEDR